jgi:hypothetical protein
MKLEFLQALSCSKFGKLTGIVSKELMILNGTGIASIEELIKGPRYEMQLKVLMRNMVKTARHFTERRKV